MTIRHVRVTVKSATRSNLQPVSPLRTRYGETVVLICSNCSSETDSGTTFADLNAKPGTYLCGSCVIAYEMTHGQYRKALEDQEWREFHELHKT